jgi:hypothetical protein
VIGGDYLMNKRMTIGLFTDVFFPMIDGVVKVVDNYGKCLSKEADVYVFAPDYGEIKNLDKLPYKVIRTKSIKIPKLDYRMTIHYAKANKIPVVATLHSQYKKDFYERIKNTYITNLATKELM